MDLQNLDSLWESQTFDLYTSINETSLWASNLNFIVLLYANAEECVWLRVDLVKSLSQIHMPRFY